MPLSDLQIYYDPPQETFDEDSNPEQARELKAYWTLYIDILVISYGGGIFDAAWLALYAALKDTFLPRAWWDVDLQSILCSPEISAAKKLCLRGCPVPMSFGVFVPEKRTLALSKTTEWILSDLDTFEEGCCAERGTVTVDCAGKGKFHVLKIEKSGGGRAGRPELKQLVERAGARWTEWERVLRDARKP